MKKLLPGLLLLLLLAACTAGPAAETPAPSPSAAPSPAASAAALPDFLTQLQCSRAELAEGAEGELTVYLPQSGQTARPGPIFSFEGWESASEASDGALWGRFYDPEGNRVDLTLSEGDFCLIRCHSAQGAVSRYRAPGSAADEARAFAAEMTRLGTMTEQAAEYCDLLRADQGLVVLMGPTEDGGFSDDQLAAYAITALARQGLYDYETGLSKEEMNAVTQKHFGRDIQNFDNSMSKLLENGRVTATGWSFDSSTYPVLDGQPVQSGGVITAVFQCYVLPDSLWLDGEGEQQSLLCAREFLLTGNDGDFPAPLPVELSFEILSDDGGLTQYVRYHSLRMLPAA